jgi:membrane protein
MARHAHPLHGDIGIENRREHRGRTAERPRDIPARGWWDIAMRVQKEMTADNVSMIAGGLAFYALLAVFPALAAVVSIYGLFASPADIANHIQQVAAVLPPEAQTILQQRLTNLTQHPQSTLSFGIVIGIAVALWSSRQGMVALMMATNVAYDEQERRGYFKRLFVSLAFTIGGIVGFLVVLLLGVAVPLALSFVPLGAATQTVLLAIRWLLLFGVAVFGLAVVYRFAPDRREARWRWITPGSFIASTLWLVGSVLFTVYVRYWGSYDKTYGTLGGVIVLLMWLYLTGYVIILGAEINSEMERQTRKDTTEGAPKPMGRRGAYSADTVGPSAEEMKHH